MLPTSLAFLSQEIRVMRGYDCTNHAKDVHAGIVSVNTVVTMIMTTVMMRRWSGRDLL